MISSRVPYADYAAIDAVSITRLKELKRSPQHYQYLLKHPRTSAAMTQGSAAHTAILEPERYGKQYAVWTRRTEAGAMAPRKGQFWDAFCADNAGKTLLTEEEDRLAKAMQAEVWANPIAAAYLIHGEPEVSMEWTLRGFLKCKGRVDWLTRIDGEPVIVGLKTARDCRHFAFASVAAKLGYHMQWAFYHDGYAALHGGTIPKMVEIVVESTPPHSVAVYRIVGDVLSQGTEDYENLLDTLIECEATGNWPGPVPAEEVLTLPSWALTTADDISDLGLEE